MPWTFLGEAEARSLHVVNREESVVIKRLRGEKRIYKEGGICS